VICARIGGIMLGKVICAQGNDGCARKSDMCSEKGLVNRGSEKGLVNRGSEKGYVL
jgi:hypothetical protein